MSHNIPIPPFTDDELALIAVGWKEVEDPQGLKYSACFASHIDLEDYNPYKGINITSVLREGEIHSTSCYSHSRTIMFLAIAMMSSNHPNYQLLLQRARGVWTNE